MPLRRTSLEIPSARWESGRTALTNHSRRDFASHISDVARNTLPSGGRVYPSDSLFHKTCCPQEAYGQIAHSGQRGTL